MIMMKKRLFKLFALVLSLIFSLQALCACNGEGEIPSETTGMQEENTHTMGSDVYSGYLNDYTLVRATTQVCQEAVTLGKVLEKALSTASGTEVKAQVDTRGRDLPETKELLLGVTNRSASTKAMETLQKDEFSITVDGNKIVIVGDNALALDRAVDYFIKNCIYGIGSVAELKDYREQRKDEAIDNLSDMSEFEFAGPTSIFQGFIQQDFAIDWPTGDIYYSDGTSAVTRIMPNGHREVMVCHNFGHMETMEIERVGDKVYIWTTSCADDENAYNTSISRFEFIPGEYTREAGQTFHLKDGEMMNYPCIDLENRYVGNWTGYEMYIYDMDLLLAGEGKNALLTIVDVSFPFEGYTQRIGCGFDISGSYIYGCFSWEKGTDYGKYLVEFDLEGRVNNYTSITYQAEEFSTYPELNGLKVERINGQNYLFVANCYNGGDMSPRYCPVVSYFALRKLDPIAPTMESKPLVTQVKYSELPGMAKGTPWKASNGNFSVQSTAEQRLLFYEMGYMGESYSLETTVTMNGAEYAGIALLATTSVSNVNDLYVMNEKIGARITVSSSGVLTVETYSTKKTYNVSVGNSFKIKGVVDENGKITVYIDDAKVAEVQASDKWAIIGGHVGCLAKGGKVTFSDTVLTYHQS